jgi:chromosome segregation ATPase
MATLYPIYTPSEPTGPPPDDFGGKDDDWLVGVVKDRADYLTETGRMHLITATDPLHLANHRLKHAVNELRRRCRITHEDYDLLQRQYNITKDLLDRTQKRIKTVDEVHANLENRLRTVSTMNDTLRDANHNLQRDSDTFQRLRNQAIDERNRARTDYDRAARERNNAQNAVNRGNILLNHWRLRATRTGGQLVLANAQLAHANNRVRFGIQTLGRLRNRLFQQIAALRIQVQWFRIRQLNPPLPPLNHPQNTTWLLLQ